MNLTFPQVPPVFHIGDAHLFQFDFIHAYQSATCKPCDIQVATKSHNIQVAAKEITPC